MSKARDLANAGTALTTVSATELGYLDGVTSAVQTQLNAKQAVVSGVNDTEIGYLDGVTSAIQTQIDSKIGQSTAINPSIVTTKGDILVATGSGTIVRQGVGSNGQLLSADSAEADGVKWVNPPASGGWTQISSVSLSGQTTVNFSSLSGYKFLRVIVNGISAPSSVALRLRFNNDSTASRYRTMIFVSGGTTGSYVNESADNHLVFSTSFSTLPTFGNNCIIDVTNPNYSGVITTTMSGHLSATQFYGNYAYIAGPVSSMNFYSTGAAFDGGTMTLFGGN